jgi:undecaprenyl-diphosphatase
VRSRASDPQPGGGWRAFSLLIANAPVGGLLVGVIALLIVGWGLGAFSESVAQTGDLAVVRDVAAGRTSLLTLIAHALSFAGSGFVIGPLVAVCWVVLSRRGRRPDAFAIANCLSGAVAISTIDKLLVGRLRPPVRHLETVTGASFPSGHATQATAFYLAVLIALVAGKKPRALVTAAAITTAALVVGIAISRVYLGVHYPSDVAGGVLLGATWCLVACRLLRAPVPTEATAGARR